MLSRIAVVYLISSAIVLYTGKRAWAAITAGLLIGYWILMTLVPVPGTGTIGAFVLDQPDRTLAAWSDRLILGTNHIWASSKTYDPEGPMSTTDPFYDYIRPYWAWTIYTQGGKPW